MGTDPARVSVTSTSAGQGTPPQKPLGRSFSISDGADADRDGPGERQGWRKARHRDPLTGGDGDRLGGPALKTSCLMSYPKRPKFKPPPRCSYVESAPKSTHAKAGFVLLDFRAGEGEQGNFLIALSLPKKVLSPALMGSTG